MKNKLYQVVVKVKQDHIKGDTMVNKEITSDYDTAVTLLTKYVDVYDKVMIDEYHMNNGAYTMVYRRISETLLELKGEEDELH